MILKTVFFYLFSSSALFIYGIGVKNILTQAIDAKTTFFTMLRSLITVIFSVLFVRIITSLFLVPYGLSEMYPFFCIIFTLIFSLLARLLFLQLMTIETSEFAMTFCSIMIAVNEAYSLWEAIITGMLCILAFYIIQPLIFIVRWRTSYSQLNIDFKGGALIFISIALLLLILFAINLSWLNFGVL